MGDMHLRKLVRLTVMARTGDRHGGKSVVDALLALYQGHGLTGATVMQGVRGFGARGAARLDVLGMSAHLPVVVEAVDEREKVEQLLPLVKDIVGSNGLVTIEEVDAL
jgi:uncharacterized protein